MEHAAGFVAPAAVYSIPPRAVLIDDEHEEDSLGFPGMVRFDPVAAMGSLASLPMGRTASWGEVIGEMPPEIVVKEEKFDRKETMKMYMRNYRRRQKSSLDALPPHERELIQQKQRERVRERVRRHRLRKKLRASGLSHEEIEQRLQELVPSLPNGRSAFAYGRSQSKMAICLDVPIARAASIGSQAPRNPSGSLRDQLSDVLCSQAPFVIQQSFVPGQSGRFDFDQRSDMSYSGENEDGQSSDMKLSPSSWSTNQVGVFLDGLELGHLKPAFERNAIDGVALLSLTTARLCDMSVGPDEIREELLIAIDSLKKVSMFS